MAEHDIIDLTQGENLFFVPVERRSFPRQSSEDSDIICIDESLVVHSKSVYQPLRIVKSAESNFVVDDDSFNLLTDRNVNILDNVDIYDNPASVIPKPSRKRSKEEVAQEKLEKQKEREEKKAQREQTKQLKEQEKLRRKIEREASASVNSKSEQYVYCNVGSDICVMIDDLEATALSMFKDRKIENQFIVDRELGSKIVWKRKCIDVTDADGKIERFEYMIYQHVFAVLVPGTTLKELTNSGMLGQFIHQQKKSYPLENADCFVLCYGPHNIIQKKLQELSLNIYQEHKAQIHFFSLAIELAQFLAQMIRGLSKKNALEVSTSDREKDIFLDMEKGIRDGSHMEIVRDWWDKMLQGISRISDAQRRALVNHIPNPLIGGVIYKELGYNEGIRQISDIICENGRRVGPALAHRIYMILTDESGWEIIE